MKNFKKMLIGCCLGMLMMSAGCGSDSPDPTPLGKVVKGPVVGATVFDNTNAKIGTTDANGNFPLLGTGPYHTTGGTYTPLNENGTAGTPIAAPPMAAPAGVNQITPLSTLYVAATPAQKAQIEALLANAGVTLNTDMSAKLAATATNASGVNSILILNETIGAALQRPEAQTSTEISTAVTNSLIAAVATLSTKTKAELTTGTAALVTAAVTTAISADQTLSAISSTLTNAATPASQGASNAPVGNLPTPTGSTGGNSGATTQG
jgi:hypothetical protein